MPGMPVFFFESSCGRCILKRTVVSLGFMKLFSAVKHLGVVGSKFSSSDPPDLIPMVQVGNTPFFLIHFTGEISVFHQIRVYFSV